MASTIKVDTIDTPDNTGNITFSRPVVANIAVGSTLPAIDGSALTNIVHTPADNSVTGAKLNISLLAGDTMYASATDTLAKLAKGTAGQVLTMNGGATAPSWAAAPVTQHHIGEHTHDLSVASGTASYTGASFEADMMIMHTALVYPNYSVNNTWSLSILSDTAGNQVASTSASTMGQFGGMYYHWVSVGQRNTGWLTGGTNGFKSNGFQYEWARVGSTTGSMKMSFVLFKF